MKHLPLLVCLWCLSLPAFALCIPDAAEMGDIGPSSERVCRALEQRFPVRKTAVENRTILSPDSVAVQVSIDGEPMVLTYELTGFSWNLATPEGGLAAIGR
jgi:hypothetical protein